MYNRGILAENGAALAIRAHKEKRRKEYQEEMERQRREEREFMKDFFKEDEIEKFTNTLINNITESVIKGCATKCTVSKNYTETDNGYCKQTKYSESITYEFDNNIYDEDEYDDEDDWYEDDDYEESYKEVSEQNLNNKKDDKNLALEKVRMFFGRLND